MAELCDYNASVANSLNRRQVSLAWTTIKTLFRGFDFDFASEVVSMQQNKAPHNLHPERGGAGEVTLGRDRVGTGTGGAGGDKDQQLRLRHLSTKLRNLSGPGWFTAFRSFCNNQTTHFNGYDYF